MMLGQGNSDLSDTPFSNKSGGCRLSRGTPGHFAALTLEP